MIAPAVLLLCLGLIPLPLGAQTPPSSSASHPLPAINVEGFGPQIGEQVRRAYAAAQARPQDASAIGTLAMTLQAYEQYELAALCYERARNLAPKDFRWAYYSGIVQAALGRHNEAAAAFRESLRIEPDYLPAELRLADSLFASGEMEQSARLYQRVIERAAAEKRTDVAQAHYGLGRTKAARGDAAAAAEDFRRALALYPEYGAAHYALGMALRDLGERAKAREHLTLSERHKLSRPAIADSRLDAVSELNASASGHLRRGVILESGGRIDESIAAHLRALEINPELVQAHINLISLYGRAGNLQKAEEHYRKAIGINPELADSHYNYGVLMVTAGKREEAAEAFRRSLERNPFHADAHHNYAVMIEREGRLDEAAGHYRKAIENRPGHRLARFHLGRILVNQGKTAEAIEQFQAALEPEDADTPRFMYALGATYARAGEKRKAVEYMREALKRALALGQTQLSASIERDIRLLEKSLD